MESYITGEIKIEPKSAEPYWLLFKTTLALEDGLKERVLNVSQYHDYHIYLQTGFLFINTWQINSGSLNKYTQESPVRSIPVVGIINGNGISFSTKKKADKALFQLTSLLNKYIASIAEDYYKLLSEKEALR